MTIKVIPRKLKSAPGAFVAKNLARAVKVAEGPAYTISTGAAVNTTVDLFLVPKGIRVLEVLIENTTGFTSTTGVVTALKVGDSDNAARYLSSDVWTVGAGLKRQTSGFGHLIASSDPTKIFATLATTSDIAAGAFKSWLLYTEED